MILHRKFSCLFWCTWGISVARIKALKRSITASLEALVFMSMVYLNGFSGAANLDKDKNIHRSKPASDFFNCINCHLGLEIRDSSLPGVCLQNVPSVGREVMHLQVSFWMGPQTPCLEHCFGDQTYWFSHLHWVLFAFERHTKIKQIFKISENTHRNIFSK